ncbi:secretion protein HlyD [Methylomonas sp. AM2-LC]|uniref:secretion protein HlyD n=1 Tax=Methylomonas sp. AM2-LC TaxID=3153301 RepID=UPI003264BC1C
MKKKLIVVTVLLLTLAGLAWLYHDYTSVKDNTLILYGNVDIREVNLGFRVAGRLAKLNVDEGDKVKKGDVLATLDDEPYRHQVANVTAQVKSLRERLKLRETGNRPQEIAQAKSLVHEREATANNAKLLLARSEQTLQIKGISTQDRDNAETNYHEAEARLTSARENLGLLEAGYRSEDKAQAKADLEQAEASLANALLQVKDSVLSAPDAGIILTRAQEAGAILQAGNTVFTLSLQNPVWVRAYVHEPDLGRIHPGSQVHIYSDTHQNQPFSGKIGFISPRAEFTPKTVETTQLRTSLVYRLRIVVEHPDETLRQGMPVTIKLADENSHVANSEITHE